MKPRYKTFRVKMTVAVPLLTDDRPTPADVAESIQDAILDLETGYNVLRMSAKEVERCATS